MSAHPTQRGLRLFSVAALVLLASGTSARRGTEAPAGLATIAADDVRGHVAVLAGPALEGRDTPSRGLELAARYLEQRLREIGLEPLGPAGYRQTFPLRATVPDEAACRLELSLREGSGQRFELGRDFVPVAGCEGEAGGELVFLGFGIDDSREGFAEVPARLSGQVALILEAEPHHPRRFEGEEVSEHGALWTKLATLQAAGVEGALVVRRERPPAEALPAGLVEEGEPDISFRHRWASWQGARTTPRPGGQLPPVAEVDAACAEALLGTSVEDLARSADRSGRPPRYKPPAREARAVRFSTATRESDVQVANVVALLRGADPALAGEYIVIGAHYDHVGVDERGRIGRGADDNASGTAGLLELAQAFAASPPRRSLVFCAFAGEEQGLLGSQAFCEQPPIPLEKVVAMLNLDMLGRGDADEVAVLGTERNPDLERIVERARKEGRTGIRKLTLGQGQELWQLSDHFSFHRKGVPSLFFSEGLPLSRNGDYHTWRDTLERLDLEKVANATRLVFNTAWLLANDDDRPAKSRE